MNFIESLGPLHISAKEIPCLTGRGAPTGQMEGAPGVLYMDIATGDLYKCRGGEKESFHWEIQGSGTTPVKGVDYCTEADKAELVTAVLDALAGKVISGYIDGENNIVINGLPDGSYTVRYEMADGSTVEIGALVVGDTSPAYTNLAQPDPDATGEAAWNAGGWCNGSYMAGTSYAYRAAADGKITTNTIPVAQGDRIYVKGITYNAGSFPQLALFDADGARIYHSYMDIVIRNSYVRDLEAAEGEDYWSFANYTSSGDNGVRFIRIAGMPSGDIGDIIITRNQPIG